MYHISPKPSLVPTGSQPGQTPVAEQTNFAEKTAFPIPMFFTFSQRHPESPQKKAQGHVPRCSKHQLPHFHSHGWRYFSPQIIWKVDETEWDLLGSEDSLGHDIFVWKHWTTLHEFRWSPGFLACSKSTSFNINWSTAWEVPSNIPQLNVIIFVTYIYMSSLLLLLLFLIIIYH